MLLQTNLQDIIVELHLKSRLYYSVQVQLLATYISCQPANEETPKRVG